MPSDDDDVSILDSARFALANIWPCGRTLPADSSPRLPGREGEEEETSPALADLSSQVTGATGADGEGAVVLNRTIRWCEHGLR